MHLFHYKMLPCPTTVVITIIILTIFILPPTDAAEPTQLQPITREVSQMAKALQYFNVECFLPKTTTLTLAMQTDSSGAKYYFDDLVGEILLQLNELKLKIESFGDDTKGTKDFEYYNIVMVDSYESFRKIHPGLKAQYYDFSEYYLIVLNKNSANYAVTLQRIFDYCWQYYIINADILVELDGSRIELYTYYPFSKTHCHRAVPRCLNNDRPIEALTFSELYPQKLHDLYNCTLIAALWHVPPYLLLPDAGGHFFDGMEGHLLHFLANLMNFSIDYITPPNNEQRGLVLANGTTTGAIKILQEKAADLSLGSFRTTPERSTALSPSRTYYQTRQVLTVLAIREPWSTYEIISYPFRTYVWGILAIILLALALSVFVLQRLKISALEFIYGCSDYALIMVNIAATTLGQQSYPEPQRNFARYMLTMWVLLTLVLRSAYQGLLYDFLNSQKTIEPPDTVEQLTQRQFKLVVNVATYDSFSGVPIVRDKLIEVLVMNITDAGGFPMLEAHPAERLVTGTPRDFLTNYMVSHGKYGVFHVVQEAMFSQQLCIYFTKHSYLTAPFDEILLNLQSVGLVEYWASQYFDDTFLEHSVGAAFGAPKVPLTMAQLFSIFQIQYFLWGLATVIWVGEILWNRLR